MHFLLIFFPKSRDTLDTNNVEEYSYDKLDGSGKSGAISLGLSDDIWHCHVNHYYGYWWSDLEKVVLISILFGLGGSDMKIAGTMMDQYQKEKIYTGVL